MLLSLRSTKMTLVHGQKETLTKVLRILKILFLQKTGNNVPALVHFWLVLLFFIEQYISQTYISKILRSPGTYIFLPGKL